MNVKAELKYVVSDCLEDEAAERQKTIRTIYDATGLDWHDLRMLMLESEADSKRADFYRRVERALLDPVKVNALLTWEYAFESRYGKHPSKYKEVASDGEKITGVQHACLFLIAWAEQHDQEEMTMDEAARFLMARPDRWTITQIRCDCQGCDGHGCDLCDGEGFTLTY